VCSANITKWARPSRCCCMVKNTIRETVGAVSGQITPHRYQKLKRSNTEEYSAPPLQHPIQKPKHMIPLLLVRQ